MNIRKTFGKTGWAAMFAAAAAIASAPLTATADEYEWDPTWGLHEEEWYDPSDWFDATDGINVEEVGNYGYDDSYYGGDVWTDYGYTYDYGYNNDEFTNDYYQYDPAEKWVIVTVADEQANQKAQQDMQKRAEKENPEVKNQDQVAEEDVVTMKGTIAGMGNAQTKGADAENQFLRLQVDKDRSVIVDLGPADNVQEMNLQKGDKVQVRGPRAKVGGKYVLLAQQVSKMDS